MTILRNGGGIRYGIKQMIATKPTSLYLGWDDPTPIYCMKANPNIRTLLPLVCKPNKAAIAERQQRGLNTKPFPVAEAKNGNGETVEITVDGNDKIIDVKKKGLTGLQMALLAGGAFLLFGG